VVYADSSNTVSALNGQSCTIDVSRAKYRRLILNAIPIAGFFRTADARMDNDDVPTRHMLPDCIVKSYFS